MFALIFTNLPEHMVYLSAVVVDSNFGFPIAPHNLQRIVKSEQEDRISLIADVWQLLIELLGCGDLRDYSDPLGDRFPL